MTKLFKSYNKKRTYEVVDEAGNLVATFRLKLAAIQFVWENEKYYGKLEVKKVG